MKKPINPTTNLALDEDFVKRATAMRGGQSLDTAFLKDLLEAGLAIMELSAGSHDDRCDNPECSGCRIRRGEEPRAAMVAEFEAVRERLQQAAEAREAGADTDRAVTIMVSETSLIFMAWLDRLLMQRVSGGLRVVGSNINLDRPSDIEGASRFLAHMLVNSLEQEMALFVEGRHYLLFPPRDVAPGSTIH